MNRIYLVSIHVRGSSWNLLSLVSTSRYSFIELWKLAQASTDFYPLALYVHEGRLFGTGVRLSLSLSRSPSSATLALLRSAVRRDRFIPEIYFLLKRSRKRLVGVSVPFSLSPRPSFTIQSSVRCSLKNEFAPATRRVREQRGRPLSRNARSYYFTWTLAHEAHTLKLYEAVRAFGISFQHFSFVDLRRLGLHPNRISWPRRFSISSSISIFLGKCVSNLCLLDFDEIFLYTSNSLLYRSKILEIF